MNGLKTAIRVLLRFLFLLFRVFGEYFLFAMGQCHGDFSQSTAQFLNLVGRQGCLSTHPLSALPVEINCGAIVNGFVLEYRQRLERRPRTGQDGFHLGLLQWRGSPAMLALLNLMFRPKAVPSHDLFTTLLAATNLSCKASTLSQEISFSEYADTGRKATPGPKLCCSFKLFLLSCIQQKGCRLLRSRKTRINDLGTSINSQIVWQDTLQVSEPTSPKHSECGGERHIENKIDRHIQLNS
jgi:hypothetical protein